MKHITQNTSCFNKNSKEGQNTPTEFWEYNRKWVHGCSTLMHSLMALGRILLNNNIRHKQKQSWVFSQKKSRNFTRYFCEIQTRKSGAVPLRKWRENWWRSTQRNGIEWSKRKQRGVYFSEAITENLCDNHTEISEIAHWKIKGNE